MEAIESTNEFSISNSFLVRWRCSLMVCSMEWICCLVWEARRGVRAACRAGRRAHPRVQEPLAQSHHGWYTCFCLFNFHTHFLIDPSSNNSGYICRSISLYQHLRKRWCFKFLKKLILMCGRWNSIMIWIYISNYMLHLHARSRGLKLLDPDELLMFQIAIDKWCHVLM